MGAWLTCIDVDATKGTFAVGRQDGKVVLADLATGQPHRVESPHDQRVTSVVFDGTLLWTAAFDGRIAALDPITGELRRRFDTPYGEVGSLRVISGTLLTAGADGNVRLWDPETTAESSVLDEKRFGPAYAVAATPEWIAIGYSSGDVAIWRPESPAPGGVIARARWKYEGHFQPAGRGPCYAIAVTPSQQLAAFARDRAVCLHAPGEWPQVERLPIPLACNDLQFNANATRLIGAGSDREVKLWEQYAEVGNPYGHWINIRSFGGGMRGGEWQQEMIYSAARFVGDDRVLAASFDGTARLFSLGIEPERVARLGDDPPAGWDGAPPDPA
jgi:WD40 repeat protein